ncbi:MAG: hypothetical protein JST17_01935 [Bacteroidetes bacterium]|nr:hypothetical protein [Bacteroidota bacterium]MBS1931413.1 hypothetical protein [Bacteroidota bacterium]
MKAFLSVIIVLLFQLTAYAQQNPKTQKELEAYMKSLQKKSDSMLNSMKKKSDGKTNNIPGSIKTEKNKTNKTTESLPAGQAGLKLPELDSVRVRSLPKKILTPAELSTYLNNLYDQLCRKFPEDAVNSAKSIASKLGNDPAKLEAAALIGWQNGADEEAIILITKATTVIQDGLLLTNAGGILDMYGMPEKAIPVLRTVVSHAPQNVIALNNLGQAYTAIGMRDSAMYYFSRCLSLSSQHPEANNTAGYIELKRGNKEKAQSYFENSLRGSFNISAYNGLATIFKDNKDKLKIAHLIKPKVNKPEYFNQFKYNKFPRQCLNVFETATVREEFNAYKKMLNAEMNKFRVLEKEAEKNMGKNWAEEVNSKTMENVMKGKSYMRPYQLMGSVMSAEAELGYRNDIADMQKFESENREQYNQIAKEYNDAYEQLMKSSGYSCAKENELKNRYLPLFAQLNEEWQSRNMLIQNKYIDDLLYWCYFSATDLNDYRHRFYFWVKNYLYKVNGLSQVEILEPCEETETDEIEQPVPAELKEFDCPAEVEIGFAVGKLTINCEKFSFKAGELIVFKFEKQFTGKRQSTISIGGGMSIDAAEKVGPVKAGLEAGMDMSMYFTFDKAGNCTDAGMTYSASAGAGINFSAGERIKIKRDLGYMGGSVGWKFGINSGVSFETPAMLKDKPETPVNKNVKNYNSN